MHTCTHCVYKPKMFVQVDFHGYCMKLRSCNFQTMLTCQNKRNGLSPGKGNVSSRHFLQVIDWGRLACKAVVGVVVRHDGGGSQFTELAVWTLQLKLDGLQLCVLTPVHWWEENERRVSFHYWNILSLGNKQKPWTRLLVENYCCQPNTDKGESF